MPPTRIDDNGTYAQMWTTAMPMLDVYAPKGVFSDKHALAKELAETIVRWEKASVIPFFTDNTAAFIHELEPESFSTAGAAATACVSM
jgi:phenylpyruvate tautomerase PptA (4-oxalocrotonate tautomerase family)